MKRFDNDKQYMIIFREDEEKLLETFLKRNTERIYNLKIAPILIKGYKILIVSNDLTYVEILKSLDDSKPMKMFRVIPFINYYHNEYKVFKDVVIVKHIPHESTILPDGFKINENPFVLNKYLHKMADTQISELFKHIEGIEIKAKYSRIFCDVERYKDDDKEIMSKFGQGMSYTKYYDGKEINLNPIMRWHFKGSLTAYYDAHHDKLNSTVKTIIKQGKKPLILDLHSYSDEQAMSIGKKPPFPDVCIGINDKYVDTKILKYIIDKIVSLGLSYQINYPYSGSIIPNDSNSFRYDGLTSIMLEVNKRIYL